MGYRPVALWPEYERVKQGGRLGESPAGKLSMAGNLACQGEEGT